jgi:hypothetical protein
MLFVPCVFVQSEYHPTNTLRDTHFITYCTSVTVFWCYILKYLIPEYCNLPVLYVLALQDFNDSYKEEWDEFRHVGLQTVVMMTRWRWHECAETCRIWCMSRSALLDDILIAKWKKRWWDVDRWRLIRLQN